jgi:hypothetical protein
MIDIRFDESVLLLEVRVFAGVASIRLHRVVIIIGPFGKVIGKLVARNVGARIFEVNHNQLLVFISRLQQRRLLIIGPYPQDVAVLGLRIVSEGMPGKVTLPKEPTSLCANTSLSLIFPELP